MKWHINLASYVFSFQFFLITFKLSNDNWTNFKTGMNITSYFLHLPALQWTTKNLQWCLMSKILPHDWLLHTPTAPKVTRVFLYRDVGLVDHEVKHHVLVKLQLGVKVEACIHWKCGRWWLSSDDSIVNWSIHGWSKSPRVLMFHSMFL